MRHSIHESMAVIRDRIEINEDAECAEWQGTVNRKGYGGIRYDRKMEKVHRAVWQYHFGEIPDGMHVLHKCDNRRCCATTHLYLGTNQQNIKDKMDRDRSGKKLNIAKVREIKKMLIEGVSRPELAKKFGVNVSNITRIATGERWAHVSLVGGY